MKALNILLTVASAATILFASAGCADGAGDETAVQDEPAAQDEPVTAEYDSVLAANLGADAYGMRTYVLALLKAGPNRSQDSTEAARLQRAHMDNIQRMADEGQLILAGPFIDSGELRGIYVFDAASVEEAREMTMTDPAVQAGRLEMELHRWYGSAALLELEDIQRRITRETF